MTARTLTRLTFALAALAAGTASARADVQICSRMSYVVEVAVAIEDKGTAATRGWYRVDPAQCRTVIQGELRNRVALYPRPRAAGVRQLAAAAGRACGFLRRRGFLHARRGANLQPLRLPHGALYRGQAEPDREGHDRLPCGRRRIHRRAGARRGDPTPPGDRGLRRQSDRRHPRRENRHRDRTLHRRQPAGEHRRRPLPISSTC